MPADEIEIGVAIVYGLNRMLGGVDRRTLRRGEATMQQKTDGNDSAAGSKIGEPNTLENRLPFQSEFAVRRILQDDVLQTGG